MEKKNLNELFGFDLFSDGSFATIRENELWLSIIRAKISRRAEMPFHQLFERAISTDYDCVIVPMPAPDLVPIAMKFGFKLGHIDVESTGGKIAPMKALQWRRSKA